MAIFKDSLFCTRSATQDLHPTGTIMAAQSKNRLNATAAHSRRRKDAEGENDIRATRGIASLLAQASTVCQSGERRLAQRLLTDLRIR
jgi:hypothetical protein